MGLALHVAAPTFVLYLLQVVLDAEFLIQQGSDEIADDENEDGGTSEDEDEQRLVSYVVEEAVRLGEEGLLARARQICYCQLLCELAGILVLVKYLLAVIEESSFLVGEDVCGL